MPRKHSWRQNLQDLSALSEILIAASDSSQLYEQLTERITKILGAKSCLIATFDKTKKKFITQRPHYGVREKDGIPLEFDVMPEYQDRWNFRRQGVLLSNDAQNDERLFPYFVKNYSVKTVVIAPMIVGEDLLGIIAIMNKRNRFTEFDSYLASLIAYQAGIILANEKLRHEEKRRNEQMSLLTELAAQINSSLFLEDILHFTITAIQKTLHMNEVAVYVPAENDTFLEMKACSGRFHKMIQEQGYIQSIEVGMLGLAYRSKRTVYSNDCINDPRFVPHPMIPTKSEACIPVKRQDKTLAVVNVESPDLNAFSERDILVLETLADQLAVAFHNATTYETERKHTEQMLLLSEIVSELALIVDKDRILQTTVGRIKQRFHYYFVAIARVDHELEIICDWVYQPKFENLSKASTEVPFSMGLTGKAVRTGKPVVVNNTAASEEYYNVLEEVRSEMVVPVKIGEQVVAVLDLQSDKLNAFDDSDLILMSTLAHALSTALQNVDSFNKLERINDKLLQTSKMKEEIVQIVAHDFRSPLTVIRGYMDFLLKKADWKDERQREIMETVALQAQRLQRLAEATLKASRVDSGEITLSFEKLDFQSFLQRLITPWTEKHKFQIESDPGLPLIKADSGRLQEVIENLLSNAIKYSPDGGIIRIHARSLSGKDLPPEIGLEESAQFLVVSVSDQGIGIPPEKRELLFQRFTRIHDDRKIDGIGLGLYIVKKMIEMHGGRIWLEEKEKGACFTFAIPALIEEPSRENILIVDDDIHTLRLLHRSLSDLGFDILTSTDGREALDKLLRFQPRLIILDVLMPLLSGTELIEKLKQKEETRKIPIIVFTGKSDYHLPDGFAGIPIVSKNSGIQTLKAEIEKILT